MRPGRLSLPQARHADALEARLRAALGPATRVAGRVNGEPGLWVSFEIDGDGYWLGLSLERLERVFGPPWWLVASLAIHFAIPYTGMLHRVEAVSDQPLSFDLIAPPMPLPMGSGCST